jgi:hypothetical protein
MMTENPINNENDIKWTDSFTEDYIEIAEEDDNCCKSVHTQEVFPVLIFLLILLIASIFVILKYIIKVT